MIAKMVFLGAMGALLGMFLVALLAAYNDPEHKQLHVWGFLVFMGAVLGASGMLWLSEVL